MKQILIDEINELNLNKLIKQTELLRKDEMKQKLNLKKIKRQLDKNWEDERDLRVRIGENIVIKLKENKNDNKRDNNKHHPHHHHHHHWGKFLKRKKKNVLV